MRYKISFLKILVIDSQRFQTILNIIT